MSERWPDERKEKYLDQLVTMSRKRFFIFWGAACLTGVLVGYNFLI